MRRVWPAAAALLMALTGCGIEPTGVTDGGRAPTGVAGGVTLYFIDQRGRLQPELVDSGRLDTVDRALTMLFTMRPGGPYLHTDIPPDATTRAVVTTESGLIELMVPFALEELTPRAIDQIVCTALGVHVQGGGSTRTRVQVRFTLDTPESRERRTCPLIG
ncbi:hypothetical protein GCM10027570_08660 [Streptomonospora sediminis]